MTTPNRTQIEQRATEIWFEDCFKNGIMNPNTPEVSELKECGAWSQAVSELVMSNERKNSEYEDYAKAVENLDVQPLFFDVKNALECGTVVCGGRGTGKTSLAKTIVKQLQQYGCIVKAFDVSQQWNNSTIQKIVTVTPNSHVETELNSCVYDISRLDFKMQKQFIEDQVKADYYRAVNTVIEQRKWTVFVFEEAEIVLGKSYSPTMLQLVSVGRNFCLSFLAVAQRLARINVDLISLSSQLFIGKLHEANDLKKIKNWVSDTEQLKTLELGDFVKYNNGKTELMHVDKFADNTQHAIIKAEPQPQPQPITSQPKADITSHYALAKAIIIGAIGLLILLLGAR